MNKRTLSLLILTFGFLLAACSPASNQPLEDDRGLNVVATTTFVGEAVQRIGGDQINLELLLPPGANPHTFEPTPQDLVKISEAEVIFINGVGLEEFMEDILENAGSTAEIVTVSDGIELRAFTDPLSGDHSDEHDDNHDADHGDDHETSHEDNHNADHEGEHDADHEHDEINADPHIWLDPNNIIHWTHNIETALNQHDPNHQGDFQTNAEAYRAELTTLDEWVREQVAQIPAEDRELVTDHTVFGYFADRYDFTQVGAVIPAPTTEAEPSGKDLAALVDSILAYDVKAIFVGFDFDPTLSERVAEDTGIQLVPLYFGSLTGPEGQAPTYDAFTRYNVNAIVDALK